MASASEAAFDLRYPIGKHQAPETITMEDLNYAIATIGEMPELLREALRGLSTEQKNTPYREGGWTVRQVVHHLGDSHMTALQRLKKALTEDWPTVPGYSETAFAELHDAGAPTEWSVQLLEGVHARWVMLLQSLDAAQWKRGVVHSERGRQTVEAVTLLYAWHCRHHVAHITQLRQQMEW